MARVLSGDQGVERSGVGQEGTGKWGAGVNVEVATGSRRGGGEGGESGVNIRDEGGRGSRSSDREMWVTRKRKE